MDKITTVAKRAAAYLTPARRKAIYVLLAAVLGLAATFGVVDASTADAILTQADKIMGALAPFYHPPLLVQPELVHPIT